MWEKVVGGVTHFAQVLADILGFLHDLRSDDDIYYRDGRYFSKIAIFAAMPFPNQVERTIQLYTSYGLDRYLWE